MKRKAKPLSIHISDYATDLDAVAVVVYAESAAAATATVVGWYPACLNHRLQMCHMLQMLVHIRRQHLKAKHLFAIRVIIRNETQSCTNLKVRYQTGSPGWAHQACTT